MFFEYFEGHVPIQISFQLKIQKKTVILKIILILKIEINHQL